MAPAPGDAAHARAPRGAVPLAAGALPTRAAVRSLPPLRPHYYQWMARGRRSSRTCCRYLDPDEIAAARHPRRRPDHGDVRALLRLHRAPARAAPAEQPACRPRLLAGSWRPDAPLRPPASTERPSGAADRSLDRGSAGAHDDPRPAPGSSMTTSPTPWWPWSCPRCGRRGRIADLGVGAGVPGLVRWPSPDLRRRLPAREQPAQVRVHRAGAAAACALDNATVVPERAEAWPTESAASTSSPPGPWRRSRWWPNTPRRCCATAARCWPGGGGAIPARRRPGAGRPTSWDSAWHEPRRRRCPYPGRGQPSSPASGQGQTDPERVPAPPRDGAQAPAAEAVNHGDV